LTSDQKRDAIAAETARGDEALAEAEILAAAGKATGAVSRAYYGAFHYARALLLTLGEEPRSHGGLTRLIQTHFVRTGRIAPEVGALLSRLLTIRQDADYTAEYVITEAMARADLAEARAFVAAAQAILSADGWFDAKTP